MLKRRIIPIELLSGRRLVKTRCFDAPRDVGDPVKSSQVYSTQDADELLLLSILRGEVAFTELHETVIAIAEQCFVPFTVGGGIERCEQAATLIAAGADKVVLNSVMYGSSDVARHIARDFGRQAVVVAIDVRLIDGEYALFSQGGRCRQAVGLEKHILNVVAAGAGEIMIQSVDRDGMMQGYDLQLLSRVTAATNVPVIAAGGAGHFMHLKEAFDIGVDAAACGSLFNFGDNNPLRAKAFLKNYKIPLKVIR